MPSSSSPSSHETAASQSDMYLSLSALNGLVGGAASMCASAVTHPIDLFKVRMQLHGELDSSFKRASVVLKFQEIWRQEGIRGFYSGLTAALLRQGTYSTARFAIYERLRLWLLQRKVHNTQLSLGGMSSFGSRSSEHAAALTVMEKLSAAVAAGAIGGVISTPLDLSMVRMQSEGHNRRSAAAAAAAASSDSVHRQSSSILTSAVKVSGDVRGYSNVFSALFTIARNEGFDALWRGWFPNVQRAVIVTAAQFVSYDFFKSNLLRMTHMNDAFLLHFSASMLAGVVVVATASPVDVIRTRMMNSKTGGQSSGSIGYVSTFDCVVKTFRAEGLRGFWKGALPYYSRVGPHVTLMFVCYEFIHSYALRWNQKSRNI